LALFRERLLRNLARNLAGRDLAKDSGRAWARL
jgi:hypothetical protein